MTEQSKDKDLSQARVEPKPQLTTDQGIKVSDDRNSLKVGERGPTLLEDFILREKLTHFDHERIPERVVHARGAAAHGYFEVYKSLAELTKAKFLQDPSVKTPVFVRFSTVVGSRGSADTARDVRGFAVKFYTEEGNFDIVGNNMPVFFIQDAIKFPDLVHAAKPEPNKEIPQASAAHDTFWDFISLTPESMHMIMWAMSDRAIPRSFAMMEGFGVHTFRLVNAQGKSRFVKFHWKPVLGVHGLAWEEAQMLGGLDPDFHRRNLWESIEQGNYPEYELGLQIMEEADEFKYDFDILDSTKIWPEDLIPVQKVGKMTLNRNPDNFFAETEQVAYHTANIVPGIEFSNDPLLHGRNFSYLDTQLSRLGSPNFTELPINRPVAEVSNNQRDAHMRYRINKGRVSYHPSALDGNSPDDVPVQQGGFASYPARLEGEKIRKRSESFGDHYGQAKLFWNSMSAPEQEHIINALQFELGMVETQHVRQRMLEHLGKINEFLHTQVAIALGEMKSTPKTVSAPPAEKSRMSPTTASGGLQRTSGLSMEESPKNSVKGRKIAVLLADGADTRQVMMLKDAFEKGNAKVEVVAPNLGTADGSDGEAIPVDKTFATAKSPMYDAVFVPGGAQSVATLLTLGDAVAFLNQSYKHGKAIGVGGDAVKLLQKSDIIQPDAQPPTEKDGVVVGTKNGDEASLAQSFVQAVMKQRYWGRSNKAQIPS
jgi:catalase